MSDNTPKVAGTWYYLYISDAGAFAVSKSAPEWDEVFKGYYHPTVANHRAIGKFYVG